MCSSGEQNQVYFQEEFVAWEVSELLNSSPICCKCRFCQSTNDSTATRIFLSLLNRWSQTSYVIKPSSVCFNMINERVVIFILQCFVWMRITIMDIQKKYAVFYCPQSLILCNPLAPWGVTCMEVFDRCVCWITLWRCQICPSTLEGSKDKPASKLALSLRCL